MNDNDKKGEQTLKEFLEYLTNGSVEIQTAFWAEDQEKPDIITHQFLVITSGDTTVQSEPERLTIPMRPVGATEISGATIN